MEFKVRWPKFGGVASQHVEEFTSDLNGVAGEYVDRNFRDWRTTQLVLPAFVLCPHPEAPDKKGVIHQIKGAYGESGVYGWITEIVKRAGEQAAIFNGLNITGKKKEDTKSVSILLFERTLNCRVLDDQIIISGGNPDLSLRELTAKGD